MRNKVKHYSGYEITEEIIEKTNLIALRRYRESRYSLLYEGVNTLEELSYWNEAEPEEINIILGEDWYIIYTKNKYYIEINEWVAIESVPNKLEQTMEMFNAIKSILLLSNKETNIISTMKHNTSYKFYSSFLKKGYLQEHHDDIKIDSLPTDLEKLKQKLIDEYSSLEQFLKDENRETEAEEKLEDYIYHDIAFGITDKFENRYRR